jgi:hypothetical protein
MEHNDIYERWRGGMDLSGQRFADELLTIDCLKFVVKSICVAEPTTELWETARDEFTATFEGFMKNVEVQREDENTKWSAGIRAAKDKFVEKMDTPTKGDEDVQEILETYMLRVNASFLVDTRAMKYEFMNGIQFPGLWSRVLYKDDTPTKKYRNMLVGCRPTQIKPRDPMLDGWSLMLCTARKHVNLLLQTHPNSLLSEYDTNLRYALNLWEYGMILPDPPPVDARAMASVGVWTVDADDDEHSGMFQYDMIGKNYILPAFLGIPCGVTVSKGFVFILTTDGEIFKVQISQLVVKDGVQRQQLLIYEDTKCIVEAPNRCTIERLNFEKGTVKFPALTSSMPKALYDGPAPGVNWHTNLSPTSLLVDPCGKLIVLSCAQSKIYEVDPTTGMGRIKEHLGKPAPRGWLADWKDIAPRELTDPKQDQTNCSFKRLMCGTFDGVGDLYVCDGNWIRKITYAKTVQGNGSVVRDRTRFTVENIIQLYHAECATYISVGQTGLVVAQAVWYKTKYRTRLADIHFFGDGVRDGKSVLNRNVVDIQREDDDFLCSFLVDGEDRILFGRWGRLEVVEKADWHYIDSPGPKIRTRGDRESEHMVMHNLQLWAPSLSYLTWFGGSILLCTTTDKKPVLSFLHGKPQTTNKRPLPEASQAQRPASRPRTAPAGGGAGGTQALLQQLAQICI